MLCQTDGRQAITRCGGSEHRRNYGGSFCVCSSRFRLRFAVERMLFAVRFCGGKTFFFPALALSSLLSLSDGNTDAVLAVTRAGCGLI